MAQMPVTSWLVGAGGVSAEAGPETKAGARPTRSTATTEMRNERVRIMPGGVGRVAGGVVAGGHGKSVVASEPDGNHEVYVMDADGSHQTRLTNNPADDILPAWSPDGTKIAWSTNRLGGSNSEIFVMNADGSGAKNLTNYAGSDRFPSWSPDGTKITYMSMRNAGGDFEI